MSRFFKKVHRKAGLPPGTLEHVGEKKAEKTKITIIDYSETHFEIKEVINVDGCLPFKETPTTTWINIDGLHEVRVIEEIGQMFDIHSLMMEDILHTGQRPKFEDFDSYIFIVLKMLQFNEAENIIQSEQVSLILGSNFVISFQEVEGDIFNPVRERIRNSKGRIRKVGSDYLAYALIDAIVDHYFFILEKLGERIEEIEDELVSNPMPQTLQTTYELKKEMIFLRKSAWPLREVVSNLERGGSSLIQNTTIIYLKDVYDHIIQIIDTIETFRDILSGMLDIYLSSVSNKMNEVMKVLTIIATIFIPLTFIAGNYGMNFEFMPELAWKWSYPVYWIIILSIGTSMFIYFRQKGWI